MDNYEMRFKILYGDELCDYVNEKSDGKIFVAFSMGKDSIAAYLRLLEYGKFKKIIPYYMYLIPDLDFVNQSINYFEKKLNIKIYQIPHPSLYRMLSNRVFQPPENYSIIESARIYEFDYKEVVRLLNKDVFKNDSDPWVANGVRAADNLYRRISVQKYGAIHKKTVKIIWDWYKSDVMEIIKNHDLKLPIDYHLFGRSFDGIDIRFLKPIKDKFPSDYKKIIDLFPMADIQFVREEMYA